MNRKQPRDVALGYVKAVADKDLDAVAALLAPDVKLVGPAATRRNADEVMAALRPLGAIHVRSDVKRVFADGNDVCVIYDFVPDTPAGVLPTVEWVTVDGEKVSAIHLYYDRVPWQPVIEEM